MLWNASVLSTASSDTEPTVVITFDSAKYIFNVGENTTRTFLQSRQNWKKTRALFLTSVGTQRASGLPGKAQFISTSLDCQSILYSQGLLMTLADAGQSQMQITGPSGLLHLIASMRKYTYRDNLIVTPVEVPLVPPCTETEDRPVYKDDNISVFALPVVPSGLPSQTVNPRDEAAGSLKRKREDSPQRSSKRPSNQHGGDPLAVDIMTTMEFLRKAASAPDFDPASLNGEVAQAWRQLMIQSMFPASQILSATPGPNGTRKCQETRGAKSRSVNAKPDASSTSPRVPFPPKFSKPLPVPEGAVIGCSDPTLKPTVAYAIVGPRIRGKFNGRKAINLGLPPGPLRARLVKGESVIVQAKDSSGNVVDREIKPEDCIGESVTPAVVLLLDTPTLAHIPALLSSFVDSGHFARYLWKHAEESKLHKVQAVFHFCGDGVLEDERYKTFMDDFGPEAHHIVASRRYLPNPMTFTSAAYSQLRLNQLDPNIFPIQKYSCTASQAISDVPGLPARVTAMQKNMLIHLHPPCPPALDPDAGKGDLFHPAVSSSSPLVLPESTRSSFVGAQSYVAHAASEEICGGDVTICPLGTNSAMPSKYRNVSATLVRIPNHGYILLDAGEGTWGQLARKFGDDLTSTSSVWQVLRELKSIFISHMHGDHHIGLTKILAMRQQLDPPCDVPLYVVGHDNVFLYLHEYAALEELGLSPYSKSSVILIPVNIIHWKNDFSSPWVQEASRSAILAHRDMCASLGLESFRSVDVTHRTSCHGAIIRHRDGWSIVYSGDTIPTQKLVQAGENATLLIHESTMADDQAETAAAKMHSTVGQAIEIGRRHGSLSAVKAPLLTPVYRMKARNTLLTHFSARYPNIPPSVVTEQHPGDPTLALAFDHADIKISEMWKMNAYIKAIEQSFADLDDQNDTTQMEEVDLP
ncbi:beta-lactamase-like protein [Lanmaoa asiatica]|nr:beta-lactamase-like protein [Lanmaoa asiatica]